MEADGLGAALAALGDAGDAEGALEAVRALRELLAAGEPPEGRPWRAGAWRTVGAAVLRVVGARWSGLLSAGELCDSLDWFLAASSPAPVPPDARLLALHAGLLAQRRLWSGSRDGGASAEAEAEAAAGAVGAQGARLLAGFLEHDCAALLHAVAQCEVSPEELVQSVAALPDLALGLLGARASPHKAALQPARYWAGVARLALRVPLRAARALADKLLRTGQGRWLAAAVLDAAPPSPGRGLGVDLGALCGSDATSEALLLQLLAENARRGAGRPAYARLFGALLPAAALEREGPLRALATRRLLLSRPQPPPALWALVDRLREHDAVFVDACTHLAQVWADRKFVAGTEEARLRYVCGALLDMLGRARGEELQALTLTLLAGAQLYLEAGSEAVREAGMAVAQRFAQRLDPENPLVFPELKDLCFEFDRDARLPDGGDDLADVEEEEQEQEEEEEEEGQKRAQQQQQQQQHERGIPYGSATEADLDDPDAIVPFLSQAPAGRANADEPVAARRGGVWSDDGSAGGDSDDDSDGGAPPPLAPMGDLEEKPAARPPAYLSDCLPLLQSQNDVAPFQRALDCLPQLIATRPPDLQASAGELASALLHLDNRYALEDFPRKRLDALVALAASPASAHVVPVLCKSVFLKSMFTSVRLDALQVLVEAASELAQVQPPSAPDAPRSHDAPRPHDAPLQRVGTVTRRSRALGKARPAGATNRFAALAPSFFFPLLHEPRSAMALFQREPAVFAKTLYSLGAILACAANSVHVPRMARAMLDLLWWARFSDEALVRRAVLFCFGQVLATVPAPLLARDPWPADLAELRSWAETLARDDPDPPARQHGLALARMLGAR
jgi:hypothetical protein